MFEIYEERYPDELLDFLNRKNIKLAALLKARLGI